MKHWLLGRDLTDVEARFEAYVEAHGMRMVAERVYPPEDEPDAFEPFDVFSVCAEEVDGDRIYGHCLDVPEIREWTAGWNALVELCRRGLERTKAEAVA